MLCGARLHSVMFNKSWHDVPLMLMNMFTDKGQKQIVCAAHRVSQVGSLGTEWGIISQGRCKGN